MYSFRLSLVEALSENVKQVFNKTTASLEQTLSKLANKINTDTSVSDKKDTSLHYIRLAINKALILLNRKDTSDSTRRAVVDCFNLLETAKATGQFIQDAELNSVLNKAYNSLKAMLSIKLDTNSYDEISDILEELNKQCIAKEVNSDVEQQRDVINSVGYIIQHASDLVDKDSLEVTDDLIKEFSTACSTLARTLRTSKDTSQALAELKTFHTNWQSRFSVKEASGSGHQIANVGRDWKKDLINAGDSKAGTDLWQKFLQSEFGTAAEDVEGLGSNLKILCKKYGYTEQNNPYLSYIKHFLLNSDNSIRIPLNLISFYRVANAAEQDENLKKALTDNPITSQNLINCKQFYSLKSELMTILLGLQTRLLNQNFDYIAERLEGNTSIFGKQTTFKDALGLDDLSEGSTFTLTTKAIQKIFYQKPGTSSYNAVLRNLQDIETITETIKPNLIAEIANSVRTQIPDKLFKLAIDFGELLDGTLSQDLAADSNKARFCVTMLLLIHYADLHIEHTNLSIKDKESWQQILTWKPNQVNTKKYITRVLGQTLQEYLKLDAVKQALAKVKIKDFLDAQNVSSKTVKAWLNSLDNNLATDKTNKEIKQEA